MAKYSRTQKYEQLRNQLQNESEVGLSSNELSQFQKRLNEIDSTHFQAPEERETVEYHDPIHARRSEVVEVPPQQTTHTKVEEPVDIAVSSITQGDTSSLHNSYLDEYIKEVKQYNMENGQASSENTSVNILQQMRQGERKPAPTKPFPEQVEATQTVDIPVLHAYQDPKPVANPVPQVQTEEVPNHETMDIPFFPGQTATMPKIDFSELSEPHAFEDHKPTENIAAEVQNLIREQSTLSQLPTSEYGELDQQLEAERTARQQLLNETTQMRAQLDDYEDNLSEVSDKMRHTNKVLNGVLIVLIVVLVVVLLVVLYWIFNSRGVG